ncbi:MAG TPA: cyclopropane-fatty-acyl-phospholipid synthase family protein [Bryobacteraceae bacterium]|nr:cyclopropane-fatty-acyl-phospholipid synthase family protein [Bryobacteraceae bacterium]
MSGLTTSLAKNIFLRSLQSLRRGHLILQEDGGARYESGTPGAAPHAVVHVHHPRFYRRALLGGNIGLGEAYMDGDWTSPDPTAVIRLAVRNLAAVDQDQSRFGALGRLFDRLRHRTRDNSIAGSRKNIAAHYDLSNDFFRLFLDENLMYSCALYRSPDDSLEQAQLHKLARICEKLQLTKDDHILEIGSGWGGFAEYAVRHYGCRVTTTTISQQQHDYCQRRFAGSPAGERIVLRKADYRDLTGQFDKLVSIEMFEAVGLRHYDTFFQRCDRLLKPDGIALLQTITINEQAFPAYIRRSDWIQKYIFPGGELASVSEILRSLARATQLSLYHAEDLGTHYARTLAAWRERFHASLDEVRGLGFDERFVRMWDYYLVYCEGAFLERHVSDCQLVLIKNHNACTLYGEPWENGSAEGSAVRRAQTV